MDLQERDTMARLEGRYVPSPNGVAVAPPLHQGGLTVSHVVVCVVCGAAGALIALFLWLSVFS